MIKKFFRIKLKAFSLAELVLAMSIFALIVGSVAGFVIDSMRYEQNRWKKITAAAQFQEIVNALVANKNNNWADIVANSNEGSKYLQFTNNIYTFADGNSTANGITYSMSIVDAYRDSNGNLVETPGTLDINTRRINMQASWVDSFGITNNMQSSFYLNNWKTLNWKQTTVAEFNLGNATDFTYVNNTEDGEVQLNTVIYADWCRPAITSSSYNLPGQGVASAIRAEPGNVYVSTGSNASGVTLARALVDNNDPPGVTVQGSLDGEKANGIFGEGNYAYVTTDDNAKEVIIYDLSTLPYREVGYFNAPGNGDGASVYVSGNYGYMTLSSADKMYVFDLTSKSGSRPQVGTANITGRGTRIIVHGSYAYISTNSTTRELEILDVTNPASPTVVGYANVDSAGGKDVFVNAASTRAYLATGNSTTQRELFIIDITSKSGSRSVISSYDSVGMNPTGIMATPDGTNRAILVGTGAEEYQVIDTTNESSLIRCGGINVDTGIFGIAPVVNAAGNVYSYVLTGNSAAELMIIRGGKGGGNAQGVGYPPEGTFVSSVFDTTSTATAYYALTWTETSAGSADLKIQLRTGDTSDLSLQPWVGPDGTSTTYFTNPIGEYLPSSFNNKRYIQYKLYFTSADTISTYVLKDITVNYQK